MTKTEEAEVVAVEKRLELSGIGRDEWGFVVSQLRAGEITDPEEVCAQIGLQGLNWMIAGVLSLHYPRDIFPADVLFTAWSSEHGGGDIDPGVKWIALLRQALEEVNRAE